MKHKLLHFALTGFILFSIGCKDEEPTAPVSDGEARFSLSNFGSAENCKSCHPQYYEEWTGSMHRYSANDPIWMLANNGLQASTGGELKSWCWQCHAPIGFLTGNTPATFQFSDLPEIVKEGVNCDVCHIMRPPHTTSFQNVTYNLEVGGKKYGQLADPVQTSFHDSGYDPSFERSEACRECHDLVVNDVPVEITFTEWQNSPYGAMGLECQDCHMETYTGSAAIHGPIRDNLHRHDFVGVDVAITDFPNKAEQRSAVDRLLKNAASMTLKAPATASLNDSIRVAVRVSNDKTGHNLPTSVFFNRQMWIEVSVSDGAETVYRSGHLDANGDLMDSNSSLQPNADKDLTLFSGKLFKNGVETNVFELDSLVNNSLPPFVTHTANYAFTVPRSGAWTVSVRLLFRPFGPYLFRSLGADQYISELPIFEMATSQTVIQVQ